MLLKGFMFILQKELEHMVIWLTESLMGTMSYQQQAHIQVMGRRASILTHSKIITSVHFMVLSEMKKFMGVVF